MFKAADCEGASWQSGGCRSSILARGRCTVLDDGAEGLGFTEIVIGLSSHCEIVNRQNIRPNLIRSFVKINLGCIRTCN
jgi:hypothetical protein